MGMSVTYLFIKDSLMKIKHVIRKKRVRLLLILSAVALGITGSCVMLVRFTNSILCSPESGAFNIESGFEVWPYRGVQYDMSSYLDQSLEWTSDGSHIVFNTRDYYLDNFGVDFPPNSRTHVVAADGVSLVSISNDGEFDISGSPAISPDGSRIAYSIYRYLGGDTRYDDTFERYFEIETSSLDGSNRRRLTEKKGFDLYPAWSPSGDRIAFTRQGVPNCALFSSSGSGRTIYVVNADGSEVHEVLKDSDVSEDGVSAYIRRGSDRFQWSPDGQQLALFVDLNSSSGGIRKRWTSLITVAADGSGWTEVESEARMSYVGSAFEPSAFRGFVAWSPDSRRIAFMKHEDGITTLYTVEGDGTGLRAVTSLGTGSNDLAGALSWSPDGSEIRFFVSDLPSRRSTMQSDGSQVRFFDFTDLMEATLYTVNSDGSDLRDVGEISNKHVPSPDGSMIAVVNHGSPYQANTTVLYTMSPNGTNVRVLVREGDDGFLAAVGSDQRPSATIDACSAGVVVADPDANPGLVRDCEVLVKMVDRLPVVGLNWDADTPISEWVGVLSDGPVGRGDDSDSGTVSPPARVREISLSGQGIQGAFPDVVELTGLRVLDLSGNRLIGGLPSELGNLSELRILRLNSNELSGSIPSELGELSALEYLDLSENGLSGSIPSELGNLSSLRELHLSRNELSGSIPSELGNLSALNVLELGRPRGLTGCIPAVLADRLGSDGLLMGNYAAEWLPKCGE